ncbi:MAG: hypothetical protein NT126_07850 [Bacteroidetes bacterium]|nr:hypothetical protein [Bacteroidota bacterium]
MSKKPSDNLHRLIRSMNKPEKRYFKIYASRHSSGTNNYLKIFEALDGQVTYDEEVLLKKFSKESFINKFSIAKARLFDTILRSLDAFHANSSIDAQLKRQLHFAEILYKKSLYDQCARMLSMARKLANKHEKYSSLSEIYHWEKKLIENYNYSGHYEEHLQHLLAEDQRIAERIRNFNDYWNIKSRLFVLLNKQGKVRTKEELKKFKKIIDTTLLKKESKALSTETKYLFHHIYSAFYFGTGDYRKSYMHLKKNISLIESNTEIFKEEPNLYFSLLTNTIYVCSQLKKYDEAMEFMNKLKAIPETLDTKGNEDMEIKLFSSAFSIEITLYITLGQFEKGIQLVPKIEAGLSRYEEKISPVRKAYFYFNIAVLYFGAGKYSASLKWINRLLNDSTINESQDIHCFAEIFNIIIHVELNSRDLLPYAVKSLQRYLNSRHRVYEFETIFLEFINKLKDATIKEEQKLYKKLRDDLLAISKHTFEKTAFEYFDFISWAESKMENTSFRKIVELKAGK